MPKGIYTRTKTHSLNISKALKSRRERKKILSYTYIHKWVRTEKGKASGYKCELSDETCKGKIEWSNISHEYKRDVNDFRPLCISHHRRADFNHKRML